MSKPYWSGPSTLSGPASGRGGSGDPAASDHGGYRTGAYDDYDVEGDYGTDGVEEYDSYPDSYPPYGYRDNRWRWVAGLAAVVLLVAVVAIVAVVRDGNTATTSSTPTSRELSAQDEAPSTTPRTVIATVPPSASATQTPLPPETVVTVTTSPSAVAAPPPAPAPPADAEPATRTITYTVTGSRQLFDLISVIYTDEQGFPHPEVNVALPWSKTVVLNPGVSIESVTATSVAGQLNCAITDGAGATVVAQNNNTIITTCTN
jgi:hypothetical protein